MNEREIKCLEELNRHFFNAITVCDPIEYQKRQQNLLYAVAKTLLDKLDIYREENLIKDED